MHFYLQISNTTHCIISKGIDNNFMFYKREVIRKETFKYFYLLRNKIMNISVLLEINTNFLSGSLPSSLTESTS